MLQIQVKAPLRGANACARSILCQIAMVTTFSASHVLNERERPRVLLYTTTEDMPAEFSWLAGRSGTFRTTNSLTDVDLTEWDVIVTDRPHATIRATSYGGISEHHWSRVPDGLFIFRVFRDSSPGLGKQYFEFNVENDDLGFPCADVNNSLSLNRMVPGHTVRRIDGLPEAIQELVKSDLVPTIEGRSKQFGIAVAGQLEPAVINYRPFLIGPGDLAIAASYDRRGGASVWLLPVDSKKLDEWFDAALAEWHVKDRRRFPAVRTWQTDPAWDTAQERAARAALVEVESQFADVQRKYEEDRTKAEAALESAHALASPGPKSLLSAQDDELQDAALVALRHLGFAVRDMDQEWDERERREDFRIEDPDAPGWLVIADVTGVAKGAPGSKIVAVQGYVTKFLVEEKPSDVPGIWVIVNQLFHRDPLQRGALYRSDEIATLKSVEGLALDTAALFVLAEGIEGGSDQARRCREWLRQARGQVTVSDAISWLAADSD